MINAGIIGGGGYTAGELIRILHYHPEVEIAFVHSNSQAGKPVSSVHEDLIGEVTLVFTGKPDLEADVLFLCMGHGQSKEFVRKHRLPASTVIIDLSHDFRLDPNWVYGLPELNRKSILRSKRIANPGCFATAIQLGLLPLAKEGLMEDEIHVHAITGSTGAGQSPKSTTHFSWRNNNLSVYKAFRHQHLGEIRRSLTRLQPGFGQTINFLPLRGDFARGIFASLYTKAEGPAERFVEMYQAYYKHAPFTMVTDQNPNLKQVVNTNKCLLHLEKHDDKLLIISAIDNLTKGASGQAVQNMNLAFGFEENAGLRLKAMAF
jgi:N-acetyl-gamma-glutamyl-phosphate reductase